MTEVNPQLAPLAPASLRRRASDVLRSAIVEGRLRPGDRLKEVELAEQLGLSRAPVREALRQLEHEVLVPIRLTIESFAFRKALPLLTDEDFAALGELVASMRAAAKRGDLDELAEDDVRFHEIVIERSRQPHCLQIWRSIEPRVRAYFRRDAPAHAPLGEVADEHDELLQALVQRDEAQLIATLERHIQHYFAPGNGGAAA
jgi:DNA-binding GntR family transcriptional regulator